MIPLCFFSVLPFRLDDNDDVIRRKIIVHMNTMQNQYCIVQTHESDMISYLIDNEVILVVEKDC